ncbi:MAG: Carboxypeptidase regulatory-like domain [Candidatus Eremiobacteraeota bacterium]|jgi:hypothetical protein|nr:Carboxypeptidase regulatory-like domain [Candidatus Eremiobacteraeota bacterium]
MKTWLAGIVLFAALTTAARAEIVAGTVVNSWSNQPVQNANVTVTFASGSMPVHTTTDATGRFMVETTETPVAVTLRRNGFETFTVSIAAIAPSVMADLHIALNARLIMISIDRARSRCGAFQPSQPWDHYELILGGMCGTPKH